MDRQRYTSEHLLQKILLRGTTLIGGAALVAACNSGGGDTEPSIAPETQQTSSAPYVESSLDQYDCTGDDLAALVKPGEVIVDGRCYLTDPAAPTGAYEKPIQSPELSVAAIKTGTALVAKCFVDGENFIADSGGKSSKRWIMVELGDMPRKPGKEDVETGLIPVVWTHGSQAIKQECPTQ